MRSLTNELEKDDWMDGWMDGSVYSFEWFDFCFFLLDCNAFPDLFHLKLCPFILLLAFYVTLHHIIGVDTIKIVLHTGVCFRYLLCILSSAAINTN